MADATRRFGFTVLNTVQDTIATDSFKLGRADRHLLDRLLARAVESHVHDGTAAAPSPATAPPTVTRSSAGGRIPAGATVYYRYSLVDTRGHETQASSPAHVATPAALGTPSQLTVTADAGTGTLAAGSYSYALSAYAPASTNETFCGPPKLATLNSVGRVVVTGPSSPQGEDGYNVYRQGPTDDDFVFLSSYTVDEASLVDDGSLTPDLHHRRPTGNTTSSTNSCTVTLPTSLAPGYLWRAYRSYDQASWDDSLVYTGTNPSFVDTGTQPRPGTPLRAETSVASPPKIGLTDVDQVTGTLPPGLTVAYVDAVIDDSGTWAAEHQHSALAGARAVLSRGAVAGPGGVQLRVSRLPAGTSTWAQAVTDSESPVVPAGQNWGSLATLAVPLGLQPGDLLAVAVTPGTLANMPPGATVRVIGQVVAAGFSATDQTTTHEWSP